MRQHVRAQVIDGDGRNVERLSETFCEACADEQRAYKAGRLRESHCVQLAPTDAGFFQRCIHHRYDVLQMGARGNLRYHAAVLFVDFLRGDDVG